MPYRAVSKHKQRFVSASRTPGNIAPNRNQNRAISLYEAFSMVFLDFYRSKTCFFLLLTFLSIIVRRVRLLLRCSKFCFCRHFFS